MTTSRSESARDVAADWAVRTEVGAMDEAEFAALAAWLDADADNLAAFEEAEALLGALDRAVAAEAVGQVVRLRGRRRPPRAAIVAGALATGGAIAAAAALAVFGPPPDPGARPQTFATNDKAASVRLTDATSVVLNRKSRIDVRFTGELRRVVMSPGSEATFDVSKDALRPFVISAGGRTVRVVGTAFDVKDDEASFSVAVSRGLVHVSSDQGGPGFDVSPGRRLVLSKASGVWRATAVASADVGSWRTGRLVYDAEPLSEVGADIARAGDLRVVVAPDARSLRFTGVLKFSTSRSMAKTLALFLPIEARIERDQIVMRAKSH